MKIVVVSILRLSWGDSSGICIEIVKGRSMKIVLVSILRLRRGDLCRQ